MNQKKLLEELKEYQSSQNPFLIDKIIFDLERELGQENRNKNYFSLPQRVEDIYRHLPSSSTFEKKKEVICKLLISNHLNGKDDFVGYRMNRDGRIEVTDGYRIFIVDYMELLFPNLDRMINCTGMVHKMIGTGSDRLKDYEEKVLDCDSILERSEMARKKKEEGKLYRLSVYPEIYVNIHYLKDVIDVLGDRVFCYIPKKNGQSVYFCNDALEESVLCPVKVYGDIDIEEDTSCLVEEGQGPIKYPQWTITYQNKDSFHRGEKIIKKYYMRTYKKLVFEIYPRMRKGTFDGICVKSEGEHCYYELKLPSDSLFQSVHGDITLCYQVNRGTKEIRLIRFAPVDLFGCRNEDDLLTYHGVLVSRKNLEKDIFKVSLFRGLDRQ